VKLTPSSEAVALVGPSLVDGRADRDKDRDDTEIDAAPSDGYVCPSCPFPWYALRYPGEVSRQHRRGRRLFDPSSGQPKFADKVLKGIMEQVLSRSKIWRTGFFFDEESGAVFGEETTVEQIAQLLGDEASEELDERPSLNRGCRSSVSQLSLNSARSHASHFHGVSGQSGRKFTRGMTSDSFGKKEALKAWRPDEDSSYACLLSQQSYVKSLSRSLLMVVLASFDKITSIALCISLCTDKEFIELRESWEGVLVVQSIIILFLVYVLLWIFTARGRANAQVQADIDYVGDFVWPNGAPDMASATPRPEGDRLASNLAMRISLTYMQLFSIPYLVTDVVQLCHPRKGAMRYAALSHRGKVPRVFALGYVNKVMFQFEETVGILTQLPNLALVKLPCMAMKVYMFVSLKRSVLVLVSALWDFLLFVVKVYMIIAHVETAVKFKSWLVASHPDASRAARTVREKLLKKHFFFHESPEKPGHLEDPGALGWIWLLFGRCQEEQRSPTGYLGRWTQISATLPSSPNWPASPTKPFMPGPGRSTSEMSLSGSWVEHSVPLKMARSILAPRPGEEVGRKTVFASGIPTISSKVVDGLSLVHPGTSSVCYEFWYTAQGQVRYDDPIELQSGRADEETLQLNVNQVDEDWMYGRLVTTSSFSMKLCEVLARSSCTAFYNIAMLNLLSEIVSTKELASRFDSYILSLFLISRCLWVYIAHRRAQRALILDWHDKGEYVTNVGFFGRLDLMFSITLVKMFLIPRIVRDIVSLLHPDKRCHPFAAFGGKLYGPRSFILGFPTKDMYITESLHGIVSQVPVLVADVIITVSLCWTLSAKIGLFYFSIPEDRERWLWCRCMTWLVLVLTVVNFVLKVILFRRYLWARRRYRAWLKVKLNDPSQPDACRRALRKEWRAYFGELSQTLVHEPLSP